MDYSETFNFGLLRTSITIVQTREQSLQSDTLEKNQQKPIALG